MKDRTIKLKPSIVCDELTTKELQWLRHRQEVIVYGKSDDHKWFFKPDFSYLIRAITERYIIRDYK